VLAVEQGHEGLRKGEEPLVKLLQGAFETSGVARSGRRESRSPRSAQSGGEQSARGSADGVEDAQFTQMLDDEHDFPQPTGGRGDSFGSGLDAHRRISDTGHVYLLVGKILYPSLKGGTFYAYPLQTISRCAIRGTCRLRALSLHAPRAPSGKSYASWDASSIPPPRRHKPVEPREPLQEIQMDAHSMPPVFPLIPKASNSMSSRCSILSMPAPPLCGVAQPRDDFHAETASSSCCHLLEDLWPACHADL